MGMTVLLYRLYLLGVVGLCTKRRGEGTSALGIYAFFYMWNVFGVLVFHRSMVDWRGDTSDLYMSSENLNTLAVLCFASQRSFLQKTNYATTTAAAAAATTTTNINLHKLFNIFVIISLDYCCYCVMLLLWFICSCTCTLTIEGQQQQHETVTATTTRTGGHLILNLSHIWALKHWAIYVDSSLLLLLSLFHVVHLP